MFFPGCVESFTYVGNLNKHLLRNHELGAINVFSFDSMNHFLMWLETISTSTFSSLKKLTGSKRSGLKIFHYYACQFNVTQNKPVRVCSRKNKKGTIPVDINCPVKIYVCEEQDSVAVYYFSKHNHHVGYENCLYQPLKTSFRNSVKCLLQLRVPIQDILLLLRESTAHRDNRNIFPQKETFVSRKTIQAYARRINTALYLNDDFRYVSICYSI